MAVYASESDLAARYDVRDIAQLASDTGVPVASITGDPKVLLALEDASGDVDSALLVGARYKPEQLEGLTGNALSTLKRMVCELAMIYLMERRTDLDAEKLQRYQGMRDRHLERLRKGENVFNLRGQIEAGQPHVSGISTVQTQRLGLTRSYADGHLYPRRRDEWG